MMKMGLERALTNTPCIGEMEATGQAGQPEQIGFHLPKCLSLAQDHQLLLPSRQCLTDFT
jgi:hypothetical protein